MTRSLYIAGIEPQSGKSVVALGLMELLSKRIGRIGYFRPVIPSDEVRDNNIELIRSRYGLALAYHDMYAYTHDTARRLSIDGRMESVLKTIMDRFRAMRSQCRFILCEGTDFTGIASAFEFDFNAEVARNLGSPLLALVNGKDRSLDKIRAAISVTREAFEEKGCTVLATIVNRVAPGLLATAADGPIAETFADEDVYLLPEEPSLAKPTVGDIATVLQTDILYGAPEDLNREVLAIKAAAMNLPNFLQHVTEGALVITPGDRADVILGSLAAAASNTSPTIAGLLLSGGITPEPAVQSLVEGFQTQWPIPILVTHQDTYTTVMAASQVRPSLAATSDRKIAAALGVFESHVDLKRLESRINVVRSTQVTPLMFEYELIEQARSDCQQIVLPEGEEEHILRAADILLKRQAADLTLLGNPDIISQKAGAMGLDLAGADIINPLTAGRRPAFGRVFHDLRKHKGISLEMATDTMAAVNYFGTMMVHNGDAGGMVSGAVHTTRDTIRPALQIIRTRPGVSVVSSVFFMCLASRVLVYGDCAVNPDPTAAELADIAISSAETAATYGIEPRIAMCSYATGHSGQGKDVDKVRDATQIVRERQPDLMVEGPIQYDAAVDMGVARAKLPDSSIAGRATVLIFPDLNTGNNLYKAVQRSAGAVAIGPVLQGLNKPVNDLSRGCTIPDIINTVAITAIQAQAVKGLRS